MILYIWYQYTGSYWYQIIAEKLVSKSTWKKEKEGEEDENEKKEEEEENEEKEEEEEKKSEGEEGEGEKWVHSPPEKPCAQLYLFPRTAITKYTNWVAYINTNTSSQSSER